MLTFLSIFITTACAVLVILLASLLQLDIRCYMNWRDLPNILLTAVAICFFAWAGYMFLRHLLSV